MAPLSMTEYHQELQFRALHRALDSVQLNDRSEILYTLNSHSG